MLMIRLLVLHLSVLLRGSNAGRLSIQGNHFYKDGKRVFLSGTNQAWVGYGYDFGNNQYQYRKDTYLRTLQEMQEAGGNSIRVWVHIEGATSPHFTSDGMVDGTDEQDTLISDLRSYIQSAAEYGVLVFLTLWNGAKKGEQHERLDGLIKDTDKLQSYINNALIPMVNAFKEEPGFGGWDIINEPGGEMTPGVSSDDPCQDTSALENSGMGWEGTLYTPLEIQRFVNLQADAIFSADPDALVSVGVWNPIDNTDAFGLHDLFKDECLIKAGGKKNGILNFYQFHSYAWGGKWDGRSPFEHSYVEFEANGKPIVIGEFREADAAGMTINELYSHAYNEGYAGAWAWSVIDGSWPSIITGMESIKNNDDQTKGGLVHFTV